MPGGGPQGTVLGMFLFLILINKAGFGDQNKRLGDKLTSAASKRDEITKMHAKYVDDMTAAHVENLKDDLTVNAQKHQDSQSINTKTLLKDQLLGRLFQMYAYKMTTNICICRLV